MRPKSPRLAVRAVILHEDRLLLVNAWPGGRSRLLCAPGGGVEPGQSLPANLVREVAEETGLYIEVGAPCLVNEFHDPESGFHQVEIFFRCKLVAGAEVAPGWQDPERVVSEWHWVSRDEMPARMVKPASLFAAAFGAQDGVSYDPLETIVR
ncbi:NUDIX domain-containing protein [Sulfitobacter sp. D35]|uniref:NUDIX domain-containing protein n=1 Tax=Sulfitobacter sp. D35 TaxID=3083252 RepID=UPI00296E7525|nr:NUDIX domain-containing protein [Sulfitobacter sp. D35]MDW4497102.1 NUDIX domain-containing protein [Sulfitobacter sp. D35]